MAKASVTGTISVISNGTTYYTVIQSQLGDIYQSYLGDVDSPTDITPDFEAEGAVKPYLVFLAYSAELGSGNGLDGNISNSNMHWFVNETELAFDINGNSTNNFGGVTGHFTKTTKNIDGTTVPALQVNKNLVKINDCNSFLIKGEALVSAVNTAVTLKASYPVTITYGTENTKKVKIVAGDNKCFQISTKGGSCALKAWVDNKPATGLGYTFKWYINIDAEWQQQAETSDVFTILETQVDTAALVKLEVYKGDDLYGSDVETVSDISDPYHINPNPLELDSSGNESKTNTIEQFTKGVSKTIRYRPVLWYNNGEGAITTVKDQTFIMSIFDNAGVTIKKFETAAQYFDVKSNDIVSHGGAAYIIQTSN